MVSVVYSLDDDAHVVQLNGINTLSRSIPTDGTLNQDSYLAYRLPGDPESWVLAVFDGHGLVVRL
jgi:hypothetical protein